jgi:hypothetical protein
VIVRPHRSEDFEAARLVYAEAFCRAAVAAGPVGVGTTAVSDSVPQSGSA